MEHSKHYDTYRCAEVVTINFTKNCAIEIYRLPRYKHEKDAKDIIEVKLCTKDGRCYNIDENNNYSPNTIASAFEFFASQIRDDEQ